MRAHRLTLVSALPLLLLAGSCRAQDPSIDRRPAVAGSFYPGTAGALKEELGALFSGAVPRSGGTVVALIAPHAGYVFSGGTAASAFNQVDPAAAFDNIFLLGPSHRVAFEGAAVYCSGDFLTPLGRVKVNRDLAKQLARESDVFTCREDVHAEEHSVEVELPFLQYHLKKDFRIVPVVIGSSSATTCRRIADALRPYFTPANLFVISSDFSHYPPYAEAVKVDRESADAILSNSPAKLLATVSANEARGVPGLATCMCGWSCILTLMDLTQGRDDLEYRDVQYRNSGDAAGASRDAVVGYHAITVSLRPPPGQGFRLDAPSHRLLLELARSSIEHFLETGKTLEVHPEDFPAAVQRDGGAFVTLTKQGELRGCIGRFVSSEPLYRVVQQMAVAAATEDYRFPPVTRDEMRGLAVEVSVLSPMRRISSIDEIELGRHGIYLRKGGRSGTFLPQVARETGWTKEEFLGHCAAEKAGIGWDGWKDAEIYVYEADVFGEHR